MKYIPHEYQKRAIEFIKKHPIAAIFLDMGMGKTSIVLKAIEELMYELFEIRKVLIIAPKRVAQHTWPDEIKKWEQFQGLKYSLVVGSAKERIAALKQEADIYIISRDNLCWLVESSGAVFDYDMIIIDELSSFKSYSAKRFKALMKVRKKVNRIVGLTGTPTSSANGLMDLFAQFKVLDMGERLGQYITLYRQTYFKPDRYNGPIVYSYKLLPGAEEQIYDKIRDITMSMKAVDHLDMPELISTEYPVYLDDKVMQVYQDMKKDMLLKIPDGEITAANAAALSGKLSQIAAGAIYSDDEEKTVIHVHDEKLNALEDLIEAANHKPVLIVYWFKHDLIRISELLDRLGVIYAPLKTDADIKRWCNKELEVGLIHPASAGHGLNLQGSSDTMIFYSLSWSLELYQQTIARLWRQGQKAESVKIIHLIAKGTIDEQVVKALKAKEVTQAALIDAVRA